MAEAESGPPTVAADGATFAGAFGVDFAVALGAHVLVLPDEEALAREAAGWTVAALAEAIESRGAAHLVLTGGSAAVALYRELAQPKWRDAVAWSNVHLWWGDDRFVPADHPESNAGLAYRMLMAWSARLGESGIGGQSDDVKSGAMPALEVPAENVHPIPMEFVIGADGSPALAAQRYAQEIATHVPRNDSEVPVFDVVHLGVGPDGHVMSVFPGSQAIRDDAPLALAVGAPEHVTPHLPRVTMPLRVLPAARLVIVMASGAGKAEVLANVLDGERDVARWPAQAAILPQAVWMVDEAASSRLEAAR